MDRLLWKRSWEMEGAYFSGREVRAGFTEKKIFKLRPGGRGEASQANTGRECFRSHKESEVGNNLVCWRDQEARVMN